MNWYKKAQADPETGEYQVRRVQPKQEPLITHQPQQQVTQIPHQKQTLYPKLDSLNAEQLKRLLGTLEHDENNKYNMMMSHEVYRRYLDALTPSFKPSQLEGEEHEESMRQSERLEQYLRGVKGI